MKIFHILNLWQLIVGLGKIDFKCIWQVGNVTILMFFILRRTINIFNIIWIMYIKNPLIWFACTENLNKCPATVSPVPNNPNTIKTIRTEKGVLKYALNEEIPLNKKSGQDWSIKVDSGKSDHSSYCTVQVPLAKRPRMEDIDEDSSTSVQIRNHNRKFTRFGPGQTLARAFRHKQTRTAIIQKTCQIW